MKRFLAWVLAALALLLLRAHPAAAQGCVSQALEASCDGDSAPSALDATCCKPLADALGAEDCYSDALRDSSTRRAV